MISLKPKFIFVKVPKTAGTSIIRALDFGHVIKPRKSIRRPHNSILEIREGVDDLRLEEFFKFGFVRNPWDRVVSLYNRNEGVQLRNKLKFDEFVDWIQYSSDTSVFCFQHKNQLDWFTDENGEVLLDFIGRFESLNRDWEHICKELGVSVTLPHFRKTGINNRHYTEYYTSKTRSIIEKKFRVDIEYFGYTFGE